MEVERGIFYTALKIKNSLCIQTHLSTPSDGMGVKLPKLDVPLFDENLLNCKSFWGQYKISVHNCQNLSDSEDLNYLQLALRDGSAKRP